MFLGSLLAALMVLGFAAVYKVPPEALITDLTLILVGMPLISLVLAIIMFFSVWTLQRAYRFISWTLQDFWNVGKDIWGVK